MTLLDELVRHLYVDLGQSTGGPLHIVLDDGNVDDQWLAEDDGSRYAFLFDGRFEDYAQAGEDVSIGRRREIRDTCELILAVLRRMSLPERTAAVRAAYDAATEVPTAHAATANPNAVTHARVNGWCNRCGGTGRADIAHDDFAAMEAP